LGTVLTSGTAGATVEGTSLLARGAVSAAGIDTDVDVGGHAVPARVGAGEAREPAFAPEPVGYMPALDGLRGVGLLCVMAFHAGFPIASGGPLSVSMFFTLSGFLIASLSLREWSTKGHLSLARFWERRARRLLPAALVALAGIVVLQWVTQIGAGPHFRSDLVSTLLYGTNWRLAARGDDYANLFAAPSPLTHFWSLAIEEQFYVLFPLLFIGVMALFRRRPLRAGWVFAGAAALSFLTAGVVAARSGNSGIAYYGTHTRAGEILFGVVVAFLFAHRRVRGVLRSRVGDVVVRWGAVPALALMLALWSLMTLASPSLFRGVTLLNAVLTSWVVLAATRPGGAINLLLGNWPLRTLGKVSYAAYLVHWPLFILLDEERTGLAARPLFALRVAATVGVAVLSYWVVEYPFRQKLKGLSRPRLGGMLAAAGVAVAIAVVAVPVDTDATTIQLDLTAQRDFDGEDYRFGTRATDAVVPREGVGTAPRALLMGDSVSWSLLPGLALWNDEHDAGQHLAVDTHMSFGCPLSGPGTWLGPGGRTPTWEDCATWLPDIPRAVERSRPDVIVLLMGLGDIGGREVEGEWREFGDPVFDEWLRRKLDEIADTLAASGTPVLWLTYPDVRVADPEDPTADLAEIELNDPERIDTLNDMFRDVVAGRPGFRIGDLNAWMRTWDDEFDTDIRDGVHFTLMGSQWGGRFVAPEALAAARGEPTPPVPDPPPPS
jgi:peptidoglycan/LPS O-acetylase OafA/YrhL